MCIITLIKKFLVRKDGATAIEYGLIAAGIALVILPAVQQIGAQLGNLYASCGWVGRFRHHGRLETGGLFKV